jgi:GDP-D-mannose 3',5'-epimerase
MKKALVLGAGGFIGSHMVKSLKSENYFVRGVDLKKPEYGETIADEFIIFDLKESDKFKELLIHKNEGFDEIYQFAADMGGAGFIFTGENDADIMHNSISINLNLLNNLKSLLEVEYKKDFKVFYSSSACIYPEYNQTDPDNPLCSEESAYPADPDSEYGWEKLFSERLYLTYSKNFNIPVRIARYHNIYGPEGTFDGGREKVPAAICRKVAKAKDNDTIEVWGDGKQTRSFLYIDECIKATKLLTRSKYSGPVNIGSEEMVNINELVTIVSKVANKNINIKHVDGPLGVRGRNSDNTLIRNLLDWDYTMTLEEGISRTYKWIKEKI